ncbi:MAG: bifunctional DNA primase/polymerase, partial [Infirmifilum sp.]
MEPGQENITRLALKYLSRGLSIIPINSGDKTPLVERREYQRRLPTEEEVKQWFSKWPDAGIGIICGRVSGNLIVIDFNSREAYQKWYESLSDFFKNIIGHTWVVETEKGFHVYLRLKEAELLPGTKVELLPGLNLRAEGDYVVAPASIDPDRAQIITLNKREWELFKRLIGYNEPEPIAPLQAQESVIDAEVDLSKPLLSTAVDKSRTEQEAPTSPAAGQPQPTAVVQPPTQVSDDGGQAQAKKTDVKSGTPCVSLNIITTEGEVTATVCNDTLTLSLNNHIASGVVHNVEDICKEVGLGPKDALWVRLNLVRAGLLKNPPMPADLAWVFPQMMPEEVEKAILLIEPGDTGLTGLLDFALRKGIITVKEGENPDVKKLNGLSSEERAVSMLTLLIKEWKLARIIAVDHGLDGYEPFLILPGDDVLRSLDFLEVLLSRFFISILSRSTLIYVKNHASKFFAEKVTPEQLNPWDHIRVQNCVLDLKDLVCEPAGMSGYYFTGAAPVKVDPVVLDQIRRGEYDITQNPVYKFWRPRFADADWQYLCDSFGTWLAPFRFRHIAFLIGPRGSGKSTLLATLTRPVKPYVASVPLASLTGYTFGLQGLIGKWIDVVSERGVTVVRNIDLINRIVGEEDFIHVERKHKPAVMIRALKSILIAMNDPPMMSEVGGETFSAFLERLSVIKMQLPDGAQRIKGLADQISPEDAFYFLLWCRWQLEQNNWEIRRREEDEALDILSEASWPLREWWDDRVIESPDSRIKATALYEDYLEWCTNQGLKPIGRNDFYAYLAQKATKYERDKTVWFKGISLRTRKEDTSTVNSHLL